MLSNQESVGLNAKYHMVDDKGFKYHVYASSLNKDIVPHTVSKSNPYSVENIGTWLSLNAPNYELLDTEYKGSSTLMWWKMRDDRLPPFQKTWSNFKFRPWHSELKVNNPQEKLRYSFEEAKRLFTDLLKNFEGDWYITDDELKKYKSVNHVLTIKNDKYTAATNITKLRAGDKPFPFNFNYPYLATKNLGRLAKERGFLLKEGQSFDERDKTLTFICEKHGEFSSNYHYITRNENSCHECIVESMTGENNPRWLGGSEEAIKRRLKLRNSPKNRKWIAEVLKEHNYSCTICNEKRTVHAHHKDGYHWCEERRFDVSNGVCLCIGCHMYFHNVHGRINNTEEEFVDWEKKVRKEYKKNPSEYIRKKNSHMNLNFNNFKEGVEEGFIHYEKRSKRWIVKIKNKYTGYFITLDEAILTRNEMAKELGVAIPKKRDGRINYKKWTKEHVLTLARKHEIIVDDIDVFRIGSDKLLAYTKEGYKVVFTPSLHREYTPIAFTIYNPHTIWNIKNVWLPMFAPDYILLSEKYTGSTVKMDWKHKQTGVIVKKHWTSFRTKYQKGVV